jgi:hypothetical protein
VPGTGATNLGKAEDAAHASGDVGVMALTVRQDSAAALAGTDADYQPLITDASGRLHVAVGGTAATKEVRSSTGTVTSVAGSASNVTLLAANANRLGASIYNDSTADLYVKCGATASTTSFTIKLSQDDYWEVPNNYTGIIDGIWSSATGSARITEYTA